MPEDEALDWHVEVIRAIPEDADLSAVPFQHAARCLRRCIGYIGEGDEDWRVECRAVVTLAAEATESGRWLTDKEANRVAEAAEAAEIQAQKSDLLELLRAAGTAQG